jgi:glycosyltransferase involved in cell wall biosynthesis
MNFDILAFIALVLAAIPAGLFLVNLFVYRHLPLLSLAPGFSRVSGDDETRNRLSGFDPAPLANTGLKPGAKEKGILTAISVLIPARNEETNIRATLTAVLASRGCEFEVIVLDDHSTDRTAAIVSECAARDPRVRLESAPPLPAGWCGKQHACHVLAGLAQNPLLVFIDADVRLAPDALARMAGFMDCAGRAERRRRFGPGGAIESGVALRLPPQSKTSPPSMPFDGREAQIVNRQSSIINRSAPALASGVPRQELGTFSERLLLPLIHFVLLGFLPMHAMRLTRWPSMSAGCGQLFIARRDAYFAAGGHAMLRDSLHDGIKLPRAFRRAGFRTDLFDATDLATCRMYRTNAETWRGLGKNATEGLASPGTIVPMTALLLGGQVLPLVLCACAPMLSATGLVFAVVATALAFLPRLVATVLFRQSFGSALLHPLGVLALLAIQWHALARYFLGRPAEWKGRSYGPVAAAHPVKAA